MDGATLQFRIYSGYAKAAVRIGINHDLYRPTSATNPIGTKLATILASFNAEDMKYVKPNKYGHPTWFGVFDGSQTRVGDYLKGPSGTFFIAAQQALLPILTVQCNRTINVIRPQQQTGIGAVGYGGNTDAGETPLMTGWPASVLQIGRGENNKLLPGDTKTPSWSILFPSWTNTTLKTDDIITDDLQRRYVISSAELTDLGWRAQAFQVQT